MDVKDRVVVVTGGGSGIGEALVHAFAEAGVAHVAVADLDGGRAHTVAAEVANDGVTASGHQIDVADSDAIVALVEEVERDHGPIGVFVSNAGYVTTAGLEDSDEAIEKMFAVHVMAHVAAARAVIPSMAAQGGGYLLNTASAAGLLSQIGSLAYTVTKHAAVALGEWLAISHHHQGVRVSVLCPQAVRTNILANSPDHVDGDDIEDFGVASADGVLESRDVAAACLAAIAEERFLVLPHAQVAEYVKMKATDVDRWLGAMRKWQERLYGEEPLPGDRLLRS